MAVPTEKKSSLKNWPTWVGITTVIPGEKLDDALARAYARYFANATPQNDTEKVAQTLKKHVYGQTDLTLLQRPGANPDRPTLSRRLAQEQPVSVVRQPDGVIRTEATETTLNGLLDAATLDPNCTTLQNFQMQPDGTIQLVQQPYCEDAQ